MRKHTTIIRCK